MIGEPVWSSRPRLDTTAIGASKQYYEAPPSRVSSEALIMDTCSILPGF